MAKKPVRTERQIGKTVVKEKKYLIPPKYKNFVTTVIVIIVLVFFFIMNNTRTEPERGPYPPDYRAQSAQPEVTPPDSATTP